MKSKNRNQFGFLFIVSGLLIMLLCSIAYYFFLSTESTSPVSTVKLDLAQKKPTKTSDILYLKENEKNGKTFLVNHKLENTGSHDITNINLDGNLLQKNQHHEGEYIFIKLIKFGDQLYTPKYLKDNGFDLNNDGKISIFELTLKPLPLGNLATGQAKDFQIESIYELGLPPFNSHNKKTRILLEFSYNLE